MSIAAAIAITLHVFFAMIWVGGMFFAYMVLRPSVGTLEPPARLILWNYVFKKFFLWVWKAVLFILATGYFLTFYVFGGFGAVGLHVHIMHGLGLVMAGIFVFLYFGPYARYRVAVAGEDWAGAAQQLGPIRLIVATNLIIGLVTVAVAASGRYW